MSLQLGPYEVVNVLGRGGASTVFRARRAGGPDVAVKLLTRRDADARVRFERERQLVARFGEPEGFVPLLDWGETAEGAYIVMPFLAGGTLRERLTKGPLPIAEAMALGVAVAAALGRVHREGLVHRDVKPENILYTGDGRPLLADLGIAKAFAPDGTSLGLSRTGDLRGTAGYMAPEHLLDSKTVTPRADVFALGAVIYECLAGHPAFEAPNVLALFATVEEGTFPPLRSERPDVPSALEAVVHRALAPDATERFADGAALAEALSQGAPALASNARPLVGTALLLGAFAAVAVSLVLAWPQPRAAARAPSPTRPDPAAELDLAVARARARLEKGDRSGCLVACTEVLATAPRRADVLALRGHAMRLACDFAGAREDLDRALAIDPEVAGARSDRDWIATTETLHGAELAEIVEATRLIALGKAKVRTWTTRATLRLGDVFHDPEGARDDAAQALALDPRAFEAWHLRGSARTRLGDYPGAIVDLTEAIARRRDNQRLWFSRSYAWWKLRDLDRAITDATTAIELNPSTWAWATRGLARHEKGDRDGALADLERGVKYDLRPLDLLEETKATYAKVKAKKR